jgi:hypothetical protein
MVLTARLLSPLGTNGAVASDEPFATVFLASST